MKSINVASLVAVIALFFTPVALAADAPSSCGELPCRADGTPYVTNDGVIVIMPGEKFAVELKIEGDKVVGIVPRRDPKAPGGVQLNMVIENGATALIWGNHLDRPVRLHAFSSGAQSVPMQGRDCTLPPNKYSYGLWRFVAEGIEVRAFSFTSAFGAKCD
jgi:hypothetical protein